MIFVAIAVLLIVVGIFFFFAAAVGFLRFPDFYSRIHATAKGETLGLVLCLLGLGIYNLYQNPTWHLGFVQSVKLMFIAFFWFLASPTAAHALTRAAFERGIMPWTKDGCCVVERTNGDETP